MVSAETIVTMMTTTTVTTTTIAAMTVMTTTTRTNQTVGKLARVDVSILTAVLMLMTWAIVGRLK